MPQPSQCNNQRKNLFRRRRVRVVVVPPVFLAQHRFPELKGSCDSLLLVCGVATRDARDAALFAWLRKMALAVRRIGSVCAGAFLFAAAGLLNGRRATAHWKFGEELARRYPRVSVESHPLWVKDGNIYTSAGISAGIPECRP